MKKTNSFIGVFSIFISANCQINFARTYGTAADEYGQSLAKTSDGGFYHRNTRILAINGESLKQMNMVIQFGRVLTIFWV